MFLLHLDLICFYSSFIGLLLLLDSCEKFAGESKLVVVVVIERDPPNSGIEGRIYPVVLILHALNTRITQPLITPSRHIPVVITIESFLVFFVGNGSKR